MPDQPVWLTFIVAFVVMNVLLVGMAYMTYYERKVLAAMQDRMGPTRTGPKGLLQPIADGIKLLGKEDLIPGPADKMVFFFAPLVVFITAVVGVAVIPFGPTIEVFGHSVNLYVTDVNVGALFILAFSGIGVYGIILGAWASANRYSLLGGLRSAAQVVSYEIVLGLSLVGVFMLTGSLSLRDIVASQQRTLDIGPFSISNWYILSQPVAFIIFMIAAVAETNRAPFDLPEAETELVSGFHTEYSTFRFSFYFLRRAHRDDRGVAVREHALSRWHQRAGLAGILGARDSVAPAQDHPVLVLLYLAASDAASVPVRPVDGNRLESAAAAGPDQYCVHRAGAAL